jgi:hypothetical protein
MSYLLRLEREYSQQRSHIQGLKPSPSLTGFLSILSGQVKHMRCVKRKCLGACAQKLRKICSGAKDSSEMRAKYISHSGLIDRA